MTLFEEYSARVALGQIKPDASQEAVVKGLEQLAKELKTLDEDRGILTRILGRSSKQAFRGKYLHGGVGRGKTMLMDMFFASVDIPRKRRVHFHAFMQDVHARLHAERRKARDAITPVATAIAREAKLLCVDELQISDIADAMIVGRLFEALLGEGVIIVITSNSAPEELYPDGLNRQLFLPLIELIREKLKVVALDGGTDYRLGRVKGHETFVTPLGPDSDARVQELWRRLTDTERGNSTDLDVLGRQLRVPQAAHGCARFSFSQLCEAPLGPADYLALAAKFRALFVEHIPALTLSQRNEARRFVTLVDTLYDAQVRLVVSSENPPERIYPGEFSRTVSRLREMQSASWWGKKIVET
ncbi:MAG TPA: cell division protein ZapE [Aestuariivirga sp.]|nr:cell division protein ZapE [Aestuariivirga sp.]